MAAAQDWGPVVHAAVLPAARTAPPRFDLYVASRSRVDRLVVEVLERTLRQLSEQARATVRSGLVEVPVASDKDVSGLLPLRALLARQADLATSGVTSIGYQRDNVSGTDRWLVRVSLGSPAPRTIDATTGEVVSPK